MFSVPVGCLACPRTRCVVAQGPALVSAVVLPGSVLGGASWSRATYACAEAALVARAQDGRFEAPPPLEALIALNAAVFLAWLLLPRQWMARNFELAAGALRRRPWTAATATVSHATLFDLTGNVQARSRRRAHVTLSAAASGDAAGTSHCWLVGCLLHRQRLGCSHRGRRPRWAPWLSPSPPARRRCGQPCMHAPLPRARARVRRVGRCAPGQTCAGLVAEPRCQERLLALGAAPDVRLACAHVVTSHTAARR